MSKKTYLEESAIQEFERMDPAKIAVSFVEQPMRGFERFMSLLRSYRISANVAATAWKLLEEIQAGQVRAETIEELRQRLHLFAPEVRAFQPPQPWQEYACRVLEEAYDYLSQWDDPNVSSKLFFDQLFLRITALRGQLAAQKS